MSRPTLRFVATGDWHWRGSNPRAYVGDYQRDLRELVGEVKEVAKSYGATAILQPGDIFDSPSVNYHTFGDLCFLLGMFEVPVLATVGNHDLFGNSISTLPRTPLWLLNTIDRVHLVYGHTRANPPMGSTMETGFKAHHGTTQTAFIYGHEYGHDADAPGAYKMTQEHPHSVNILLAHGMALATPPPMEGMRWTDIHQAETNADIVITGHDHTGYGIEQIGRTLWVNPGALCRLSATETEMSRTIQVALITIEWPEFGSKPLITASLIPLKSARPGHECLSRDHIEEADWREERTSEFLRELAGDGGQGNLRTAQEMVEYISARDGLPEDVRAEALRRVGAAQEEAAASERGRG